MDVFDVEKVLMPEVVKSLGGVCPDCGGQYPYGCNEEAHRKIREYEKEMGS